MAHKCKSSELTPWRSRAGSSRADIIIDPEGGNGRFRGRHRDTTNPPPPPPPPLPENELEGRCFEASGPLPDRIWFYVPELKHLYFGVINANGDQIEGTRFRFDSEEKEAMLSGDDDWVATKT